MPGSGFNRFAITPPRPHLTVPNLSFLKVLTRQFDRVRVDLRFDPDDPASTDDLTVRPGLPLVLFVCYPVAARAVAPLLKTQSDIFHACETELADPVLWAAPAFLPD